VLGVAVALGFGPGCSILFVDGPPPEHERMRDFDCTTSRLAPAVDTVFAAAYGVSAAGAATGASSSKDRTETIGLMVGFAAVETVSAVIGFSRTNACAKAKEQLAQRTPEQGSGGGCGSDVDCKGDRVCEAGLCVAPSQPAASAGPSLGGDNGLPVPTPAATPVPASAPAPAPSPTTTPAPTPPDSTTPASTPPASTPQPPGPTLGAP
jgi:hypothetical protein